MGFVKEHALFALKVAVALLIINQVPAVRDFVGKQYWGNKA